MREITVFGLDVAKNVFEVASLGRRDQLVSRKTLARAKLLDWFARQPRVLVSLEACGGSHYWARELRALGFPVKMIAATETSKYRTGHQKNDARDAVAIARAALSEQVRPVGEKSEDQLQLQALFRLRERLMKQRIATGNYLRACLLEFGIALAKSDRALREGVRAALDDERLPVQLRETILRPELEAHGALDERIKDLDRVLTRQAKADPMGRALLDLQGIGPLTASYLSGVRGGARECRRGRDLSAQAGVVPCQSSTGGRTRLGRMTKRGDKTLRTLLMHGARSILSNPNTKGPLAQWGREIAARRGFNIAVGAVANKLARHAWAEMNRVATAS